MKRPRIRYQRPYTFTDDDGTWHVESAWMISSDGRGWWNLSANFRDSVRKVWRELRASS